MLDGNLDTSIQNAATCAWDNANKRKNGKVNISPKTFTQAWCGFVLSYTKSSPQMNPEELLDNIIKSKSLNPSSLSDSHYPQEESRTYLQTIFSTNSVGALNAAWVEPSEEKIIKARIKHYIYSLIKDKEKQQLQTYANNIELKVCRVYTNPNPLTDPNSRYDDTKKRGVGILDEETSAAANALMWLKKRPKYGDEVDSEAPPEPP